VGNVMARREIGGQVVAARKIRLLIMRALPNNAVVVKEKKECQVNESNKKIVALLISCVHTVPRR
jgi:hypothetical protein